MYINKCMFKNAFPLKYIAKNAKSDITDGPPLSKSQDDPDFSAAH